MNITIRPVLIAPCGMNCTICSGFLAFQYDLKKKGIPIPYCSGCRPRDKQCAFLKKRCPRLLHKTVEYCFECDEFPCIPLKNLDKRYRRLYHMSMIENLENIQKNGIHRFIEEQKQTWRCATCGGIISCHNGICFSCETDTLKNKKKMYRWGGKNGI